MSLTVRGFLEHFDLVVVGGGPSGLSSAWIASKLGVKVLVLEEHEEIGVPKHCAGLVSREGLRAIGMPSERDYVENKVKRAFVVSPRGLTIEVKKRGEPICVIDREVFDKALASRAEDEGVRVEVSARVKEVVGLRGMVVRSSKGSYRAEAVIDGEGARALISRRMGLPKPSLKLPALQVELRGVDVWMDAVWILMGKEWAPGFFAWVIPIGDRRARVGLASSIGLCAQLLKRLVKKHPVVSRMLQKGKVERLYGGVVVLSGVKRASIGNFLVVGDAAGQTKPLTGGGVVYGSLCGLLAGASVAASIEKGVEASRIYEKAWRGILAREKALAEDARRWLMQVDDSYCSKIIECGERTGLFRVAEEELNFDFHATSLSRSSKLISALLSTLFLANPIKAFKYYLQTLIS